MYQEQIKASEGKLEMIETQISQIETAQNQLDVFNVLKQGNNILKKLELVPNIDVLDVSHMSKKIIRNGTDEVLVEYCYTEITNKDVHKWSAMKFIIDDMSITPEEVVAIGDNVNDKEMIEGAGLGVAMGNATDQIKEIANVTVATNNEDGVYEAFEKYINN